MALQDLASKTLQTFSDEAGSVVFGWLGGGMFYVRYSGALSSALGARFVARFREMLEGAPHVTYYSDASGLEQYDLLARSALTRLILENRRKFSKFVMLLWAEGASPAMDAFVAAVGEGVDLVLDEGEFHRKLALGMMLAHQRPQPKTPAPRVPGPERR